MGPPRAELTEVMPRDGLSATDLSQVDREFRVSATILTLVFWIVVVCERTLTYALQGATGEELVSVLKSRGCVAVAGIVLCLLIHVTLNSLRSKGFLTVALGASVISLLAGYTGAQANYFTLTLISPGDLVGSSGVSHWVDPWQIAYWGWIFLAWTAFYLALYYSYRTKATERRARIIENLAHAAQLRALHNQIRPHFLFNTLNSISSLVLDGRSADAEAMLRHLSDFFRATLALDPLSDISVAEELHIQKMYLAIEQARFPDMRVDIHCGPGVGEAMVPALLIQPLVENAVKYGVARSPPPTRIDIAATRDGDRLVVAVTDDGRTSGPVETGLGVGLRNVRERLQGRFRSNHDFEAGPKEGGGFRATVALPFVVAEGRPL